MSPALYGSDGSFPLLQTILRGFDMQIIARSVNEGLVIDDNIRVTVLEIQHNRVRLGIETPNQAPYYREEVVYLGDGDGDMIAEQEATQPGAEPLVPAAAL
jgi:carbon storage regulator